MKFYSLNIAREINQVEIWLILLIIKLNQLESNLVSEHIVINCAQKLIILFNLDIKNLHFL